MFDTGNNAFFSNIAPYLEESLHFGLHHHDFQSQKSTWSPGIFKILCMSLPEKMPGEDFLLKHAVSDERENLITETLQSMASRNNYISEFSVEDSNGIYKRLQTETIFINNSEGVLSSYTQIIKDITENYEYKSALEQKVVQLDKSNKNLLEFAYVASHDLQEPVRKISTFAERLSSKFSAQLGEEGNTYLSRMQNAGKNMQTLLEDLLNYSRLTPDKNVFEKVALDDCLKDALNDLDVKIEETSARIEFTELPVVEGFKTQLKQLLGNLLANAIKFKKAGTAPNIKITCSRVNPYVYPQFGLLKNTHYVKLDIEDNGIGFEQEYAEKIFMIFQRLNSKAEYSGSGIGLAICKRIVENHHGQIYASSIPGVGSTFTLLLPYKIL